MVIRLFLSVLLWVTGTSLLAQADLRAEFNASTLSTQEKRILQAALAYENHYQGLLDGAWGRGSQSALVKMVTAREGTSRASWDHVIKLEKRFRSELDAQGWRPVKSQGISILAPMSLLSVERSRRGEALVSRSNDLQLRILPQTIAEALNLANAVIARHKGKDKPYQSLSKKRLVVSAIRSDGGGIYMRTNEVDGNLVTALLEWDVEQAARARIMLSSIKRGEQGSLDLPWDSTLAKLARTATLKPRPTPAKPKPKPTEDVSGFWPEAGETVAPAPMPRGKSRVSGNAFFVNNTDLITAAHTVQGCKSLSLPGLGAARVVVVDPDSGLALITSQKRSPDWVDVSRTFPKRGDSVIVVGFASQRADEQKFFAHSVVVDKQATAKAQTGRASLKRNAPNADHGSIVLDFDRKLAGLIVRHPNPTRETRHTYLASAQILRAFLRDNNVMFSRGERNGPRPLTEDSLKTTVWRVACQGR